LVPPLIDGREILDGISIKAFLSVGHKTPRFILPFFETQKNFLGVKMSKRIDDLKRLAGSPWADLTPLRRRGRPRKFATNNPTERKRASRAAQKLKDEAAAVEKDRLAQIAALQEEQAKDAKGNYGSLLVTDADRGKGVIETGGFNTSKIDSVDSARMRDGVTDEDILVESSGSGRRAVAEGASLEKFEQSVDNNDFQPQGWKKPSGEKSSEKTNKRRGNLLCDTHSIVDGPCQSFRVETRSHGSGKLKTHLIVAGILATQHGERWLLPLPAERVKGGWKLSCGCFRPGPQRIIVTSASEPAEEEEDLEVDDNAIFADALRRKWKLESNTGGTNTPLI
jgi:hypothetical protein